MLNKPVAIVAAGFFYPGGLLICKVGERLALEFMLSENIVKLQSD